MPNPNLKYLFGVRFSDGSEYLQNPEDRSLIDPEKRSCFYDVMQRAEDVELFQIVSNRGPEHEYLVDLRDGHFEVDGVPFWVPVPDGAGPLRIVFFRQHTHQVNAAGVELAHTITYHIGWQTTDQEGRNHQFVIEVR